MNILPLIVGANLLATIHLSMFENIMNTYNTNINKYIITEQSSKYVLSHEVIHVTKKSTKKLEDKINYRLIKINNGFAKGYCVRYVAIKKFPYLNSNTQQRLIKGNANQWYSYAKNNGIPTGETVQTGSVVVFKYGGKQYRSLGHVAIVKAIDGNKIQIEEMYALGKYIVSTRRISINHPGIIGYIYI